MDIEIKEQLDEIATNTYNNSKWLLEIMDLCNEQTVWLEELEEKLNSLILNK